MSTSATPKSPLEPFSKPVRKWFEASFEAATPAQAAGWPAIASGNHTLICAPTGSGKTLASFLWGIDRLAREPDLLGSGVRIVYVSPLKALSYDIERNLRAPLQGIGAPISVALRTGDTPQSERRKMRREPPDILITTPESLYLMISSGAREILGGVEAVIVDEIHAVAPSKRGSHLALTLERLDHLGEHSIQRIGLSATQRPLERIGQFLVGAGRECEIVDASEPKQLDLEIVVPVEDMAEPSPLDNKRRDGADTGKTPHQDSKLKHSPERIDPGPIEASLDPKTNTRSIWPAIYPELLRLVREHSSTIVFVNNRRASERIAKRLNEMHNDELEEELPATEHAAATRTRNGDRRRPARDRPRAPRVPLPRGARPGRGAAQVGRAPLPGGDLLAGARHRHGRRGPGHPGRVPEVRHARAAARRPCRPHPGRGLQGPDLPQVQSRPPRVRRGRPPDAHRRDRGDRHPPEPPRRARPAPRLDGGARRMGDRRSREAGPLRAALLRALPRAAGERARHARRPLPVGTLRRAAAADRLGPDQGHDARAARRTPARRRQRRDDPRPRPLRRPPAGRPPSGRARRGDGLRGAPRPDLPARREHLADRGDHPRPRDRHPRARDTRSGSLLARRRDRPSRPSSARRSAPSAGRRSTPIPSSWPRTTTSTSSPRRTSSTT